MICDPPPAPRGELAPHALRSALPQVGPRLPLAEIRWARISLPSATRGHPRFGVSSPWPAASYRWSVSGGELLLEEDGVAWQLPASPGRYLLQVIADWGADGLAVDALVLVVDAEGGVTLA
jgi:hypothetical protein